VNEQHPSNLQAFPPSPPEPRGVFRMAMESGVVPTPMDRRDAALAHILGAIVGLFSAGLFFPVLAPTIVLLFNTTRSPFVLFHVNQAAWFQGIVSLGAIIFGVLFVLLYFVTCGMGIFLLPLALFPWLASVAVPFWVAMMAYDGKWSGYPWLRDWVLDDASPLVAD